MKAQLFSKLSLSMILLFTNLPVSFAGNSECYYVYNSDGIKLSQYSIELQKTVDNVPIEKRRIFFKDLIESGLILSDLQDSFLGNAFSKTSVGYSASQTEKERTSSPNAEIELDKSENAANFEQVERPISAEDVINRNKQLTTEIEKIGILLRESRDKTNIRQSHLNLTFTGMAASQTANPRLVMTEFFENEAGVRLRKNLHNLVLQSYRDYAEKIRSELNILVQNQEMSKEQIATSNKYMKQIQSIRNIENNPELFKAFLDRSIIDYSLLSFASAGTLVGKKTNLTNMALQLGVASLSVANVAGVVSKTVSVEDFAIYQLLISMIGVGGVSESFNSNVRYNYDPVADWINNVSKKFKKRQFKRALKKELIGN